MRSPELVKLLWFLQQYGKNKKKKPAKKGVKS